MVLEICVDSVESARSAQSGGAQRVELCSDLLEGGITPSVGLIGAVRESLAVPVFVMIRPRAGDFFYSAEEFNVMKRDIGAAKSAGADGVVLGVLLRNGEVDVERTRALVDLARPMGVTFHRAIDWAQRMEEALEHVISTGADRVLTSGGMPTAGQGIETIARLVAAGEDRISVMVCGNIRRENIGEIAKRTNASEFHASLRRKIKSPMTYRNHGLSLCDDGIDEFARYVVAAEDVRALGAAMQSEP